jgi:hypothetical protein
LRTAVQDGTLGLARQTVLLGEAPRVVQCGGESTLRFRSRGSNRVRLRTSLSCTGMVILANTY